MRTAQQQKQKTSGIWLSWKNRSIMIPKYYQMAVTIATHCGVIPMTRCASGWATCITGPMKQTVTASGHAIQAVSSIMRQAALMAASICTSWVTIKQQTLKAPMALHLKAVPAMLITTLAAAKTSCLQAACMEPGRQKMEAIQTQQPGSGNLIQTSNRMVIVLIKPAIRTEPTA